MLRIVGHSLGGATAALMALMLRKYGGQDVEISPELVSAFTIATPPCVPKTLAVESKEYISTIVLQVGSLPICCSMCWYVKQVQGRRCR